MTIAAFALEDYPLATAGEIAVVNHESSLDRSWRVFRRWPHRSGTAEQIVDEENRSAHFLGDATALDRLAVLSSELLLRQPLGPATHLIAAAVASTRHHFAEARGRLVQAESLGAQRDDVVRLRLTLDQALGESPASTLAARRAKAEATGGIQDLVPLGALLAELGEFEEADWTYTNAISRYRDVSPFPLAWTCFQLGMLWGETVPKPDPSRAAHWYRQAIAYLPAYTHARVHLAEIHLEASEPALAEALLRPVQESSYPEVKWRLAEVLATQDREAEALRQLDAARWTFETLLGRHELAFVDHAAEFYLSAGGDTARALELARVNLSNRPTLRAFKLAHKAGLAFGKERFADELVVQARAAWGHTAAFQCSRLADRKSAVSRVAKIGANS